jgi:hypothetical protein
MKGERNQIQLDNPNNPELDYWQTSHDIIAQIYRTIDFDIQPLCKSLWEHGVETRWSCSGKLGHMCSRTVVIIPADEFLPSVDKQIKDKIESTMKDLGIVEYWLSRVYSHVKGSSGMQDYWLLEIPNMLIDSIAYPIPYRNIGV